MRGLKFKARHARQTTLAGKVYVCVLRCTAKREAVYRDAQRRVTLRDSRDYVKGKMVGRMRRSIGFAAARLDGLLGAQGPGFANALPP
jgi:hypothetical protein